MTPRLIAFYEGSAYGRMARVLAHTATQHCVGWDIRVEGAQLFGSEQKTIDQRVRLDNCKLLRWTEAVEAAPDQTPMLVIDCDVMILRPLDDLWQQSFDVAYTIRDRERTPLPLNAGVVFVRATAAARRFLRAWYDATVPMRADKALAAKARKQYGACDQAGLAQILKTSAVDGVQLLALPCQEWNCEDSEWGRFDPSRTRIVHIKGALRKAIFGERINPGRKPSVMPLAKRWKAYEASL